MALEALPNYNDLFNVTFEALYATQYGCFSGIMDNTVAEGSDLCLPALPLGQFRARGAPNRSEKLRVQGRSKRRRRPKTCKNREQVETQRMTHITVERNRRKQMNEHLAVLRSLMPQSYAQKGDQASIVGGAVEYVKELEYLVHSLEAQKLVVQQQQADQVTESESNNDCKTLMEFFSDPQWAASQIGNKYALKNNTSVGDIEVILIETHVNLRILSKNTPRQHLWRLVSGFQTLHLSILHLNVVTFHPLVLYSISAKVEEGCQFTSVDSIAEAVHHMLTLIEEDA